MTSPVRLRDSAAIGRALQAELNTRFPDAVRGFLQPPLRGKGGMEATVFYLQLDAPGMDEAWQRPLIMRVPRSSKSDHDPSREAKIQTFLTEKGFPTAAPLALGRRDSALGRPWLLMERIAVSDPKEHKDDKQHHKSMERIAGFQAELHRVDTQGWPLDADGPLVDRRLAEMMRHAETAGPRARATVEWLSDHAHVVRDEDRSVLHNDFMGNVLVTETGSLAAVDWAQADVGDYHDDVARTMNLMCLIPLVLPLPAIRAVANLGINAAGRKYREAYRKSRELDHRRLRYWAAMHTAEWALMLSHGAAQLHDQRPYAITRRISSIGENRAWRLRDRFWELVQTPAFRPL